MRHKGRWRRIAISMASGGIAYVGGSYLAARQLSRRLISAEGLGPLIARREDLLAALESSGAFVADYRHAGSPRVPAALAAIFASPGQPERRATILFLHGKGGSSAEWQTDALRALALGYNVLLPDLRGHRPSEGDFVTYGLLEKDDLAGAIEAAWERFHIDPERLGLHACSAGSTVALEFAAGRPAVRALWLESPYANPLEMARHYLSVATRLPRWTLALTTRWAVARAMGRIRRDLHLTDPRADIRRMDPVSLLSRIPARIYLVHGKADELVPPHFAHRLEAALPADAVVWRVRGAGHCHHDDEPQKVAQKEYVDRWTKFFGENLPASNKL